MPVCHLNIDRMNGEEKVNAGTNLFSRGPGWHKVLSGLNFLLSFLRMEYSDPTNHLIVFL